MNNVKEDPRRKTDANFDFFRDPKCAYEVFIRRNLMQCYIFLHQKRLKQVCNSDRLVEGSFPQGVFYGLSPYKNLPPSLWLALFSPYDDLNSLPLCSSQSHKYNNYEKTTYIFFSYPQTIHLSPGKFRLYMKFPPPDAQCKRYFAT